MPKKSKGKKLKGSGKKYSVLAQACTRSDGKKGTHVLKIKPKPGKYKGRERDSQGRVKVGCHKSAAGANAQRSAIEAGKEVSGTVLKERGLRNYIKKLIKESLDLPIPAPPEDTPAELLEVIEQYHDRVMPDEMQYDLDENVARMFHHIIEESGERFPYPKVKVLETSVNPVVLFYKKLFNRKRPSEFANHLGLSWSGDDDDMSTTNTPSYPSGHTCQAYYLAHTLGEKFPALQEDLLDLAEAVAQSRVDRGVHYPSDLDGGRELAWHLYKIRK